MPRQALCMGQCGTFVPSVWGLSKTRCRFPLVLIRAPQTHIHGSMMTGYIFFLTSPEVKATAWKERCYRELLYEQ